MVGSSGIAIADSVGAKIERFMRTHLFFTAVVFMGLCWIPVLLAQDESAGNRENWQVPVTLGKDGWMLYANPRFGFVLPVPPGMKALRPPDNGGGQAFESADGKVQLTSFGSHNVDGFGDVEKNWNEELAQKGRTVTYKRKTESWYVISGTMEDGTGFYTRYEANAKHGAGWTLTYPQAEEKRYARWVERIAKGYEARLGKGDD
jgi:hypothetical protein